MNHTVFKPARSRRASAQPERRAEFDWAEGVDVTHTCYGPAVKNPRAVGDARKMPTVYLPVIGPVE